VNKCTILTWWSERTSAKLQADPETLKKVWKVMDKTVMYSMKNDTSENVGNAEEVTESSPVLSLSQM